MFNPADRACRQVHPRRHADYVLTCVVCDDVIGEARIPSWIVRYRAKLYRTIAEAVTVGSLLSGMCSAE